MDETKTNGSQRIGVLAADPLRAVGLETILNSIDGLEAVVLPSHQIPGPAMVAEHLQAVILDQRATHNRLDSWIRRIRQGLPSVRVLVLGEDDGFDTISAIIAAGAKGFLRETAAEEEIRMALSVVLDGSLWAPRKVLAQLIEQREQEGSSIESAANGNLTTRMTPREIDVLELLKDGRSNRDIAQALGIDETTVKAHMGRMLRKTGASNRVELTLRAMGNPPRN